MGLYVFVFFLPISFVMIERIYTLSYYHHSIGGMNYYPLFRVRSWKNGICCVSLYILTLINIVPQGGKTPFCVLCYFEDGPLWWFVCQRGASGGASHHSAASLWEGTVNSYAFILLTLSEGVCMAIGQCVNSIFSYPMLGAEGWQQYLVEVGWCFDHRTFMPW